MTDTEITLYAAAIGGTHRQQVAQAMRHVREHYEVENAKLQMLVAQLHKKNAMLTDALNAAKQHAVYS